MSGDALARAGRPGAAPRGGHGAAERSTEEIVERFRRAYDERDVEGALGLLADDAVWVVAPGAFKGKEGVRRVLEWDARLSPTARTRPSGIGLLVKDDVAVNETVIEETFEGVRCEYPCLTVFELDEDRKIRRMRSYYEKLGIMQQIAMRYPGIKGWLFRKLVNLVVAQGEKGLDRSGVTDRA